MEQKTANPSVMPIVTNVSDAGTPHDCLLTEDAGFRTLFLLSPQPMWIFDFQTLQFLHVNDAAIAYYGYSRQEFQGMLLSNLRPQEDIPRLLSEVAHAREGGPYRGEWRHRLKDGRLVDVEVLSHNVLFRGREAQLAIMRDITRRSQAEEALRQAETKYALFFEDAVVGFYQSTPDGRVLSANPAMARMYGVDTPEEFVKYLTDVQSQVYVNPEQREEYRRLMEAHGVVRNFEVQVYRRDRSKMWLSVNGHAVRENGKIVRYEGTLEDITERRALQAQLVEAKEQYREIFDNAIVGIFQSTPEGRYLNVNPAMAKMMGYDSPQDLIESVASIEHQVDVDPNTRKRVEDLILRHGAARNVESEFYRKDGSKAWLSSNVRAIMKDGVVSRYEGMNEDITQRKQLEDQLRQAQKMDAVGQLAGGVAHDFNNALAVITGYSDLLQMSLAPESTSHRHAEEIAKAARRAAALTRQLLAFSRKQVIQPVVLDLNSATHELEKMLRRLIGEHIEMTFQRSLQLGRVRMDPGQVEQILMNLCVNARDAMPQGGKLSIQTANAEFDEAYASYQDFVPSGSYVMLSVSDTGSGISLETQRRIFEPFFTTKDPGKGTGLGLSTVYGIVQQNHGHILVDSEIGQGTTFRLYLPRLKENTNIAVSAASAHELAVGTETVLVVEDEDALRILARTCLENNGYEVLDAPDAATALQIAKTVSRKIHMLLTDMVMPGMGGRELANQMLALHPETKILFMSGYTNDLIDEQRSLEPGTELLEKPFTLHALLSKVSKVIHGTEDRKAAAR